MNYLAFVCWLLGHKPFKLPRLKIVGVHDEVVGYFTPHICTRCMRHVVN